MFSNIFSRRTRWATAKVWATVAIVLFAVPALAQTGRVQGKVTDEAGKAVVDAKISVYMVTEPNGQKWQATSDKNGNYIIGTLPKSGNYVVHAEKEGAGVDESRAAVKLGNFTSLNLVLSTKARMTEEQAAKNASFKTSFNEGLAASTAGNHQVAIDAFMKAASAIPTCSECYYNIGVSQTNLKKYDEAEAAYKKAIELKPAYPEAYNALAEMYTQQNKVDMALAASQKAAELSSAAPGGGSADSLYNTGVHLWNANKFAEAQQQFEAALKLDPNYAEAHFMVAKAYLNAGKLKEAAAEYDAYLKMAPTGKNAAEAKTTSDALKPMLK